MKSEFTDPGENHYLPEGTYPVTITGMPQAGSTLCYNLVRLLAEESGATVEIYYQDEELVHGRRGTTNKTYFLSKQHDLPPTSPVHRSHPKPYKLPEWLIINVKRDLRDTIASAVRKNPAETDIRKLCKRNIQWHYDWEHAADYEWIYEKYKEDPLKITQELHKTMGLDLSMEQVRKVVNMAEGLKESLLGYHDATFQYRFEKITRMNSTQITNNGEIGGYRNTLTDEQIDLIETEFGDWLRKHGYME